MGTPMHHTPADSLRAAALNELDAYNNGWPCADLRAVAFLCLRSLCVRVIEWRHAVGQPCTDACDVMAWVEDRIDAGTLAWPTETRGVAASARYDLLRKAARLEFDLHKRAAERVTAELFRAAEGAEDTWDEPLPNTAPWAPTEAETRDAVVRVLDGDLRPAGYTAGARLFAAGMLRRLKGAA